MHSALTPNQSERIAGRKTDRRSFFDAGEIASNHPREGKPDAWQTLAEAKAGSARLAVCEEKRGFLFEKARRKMLTDGRKRTKHRETLVREKTNDEEKRKVCFHFSISML